MNFEIIIEKPLWFILLCLLLGAVYSIVLYRKENLFEEVRSWIKKLMAAFRFIVVSLLAFLLLSPLIRTIYREAEKPIIIIAQDNSQSILSGADSATFIKLYSESLNKISVELKKNYDVRLFSFGEKIQDKINYDFSEKQTDISKLFDELSLKFANRNVGAIILASDGMYNTGGNPLYANDQLKAPVYTIALGDTTVKKDILISRVNHNRVAFLGNTFPLEVIVDAKQCSGEKSELIVEKDSFVLFRKTIEVAGNKYHVSVPVYLEAKTKGIQHFKIKLSSLQNEISIANNAADIFIEVTESKQKVLILANAPHPDIAALKSIIEGNQNYEVKLEFAKDFKGNANDYNLVILHQLPSNDNNSKAVFDKFNGSDVSLFYILGSQTNINDLNELSTGITISENQNKLSEVQASTAKDFSLFNVNDELLNFISTLPPLASPFGIYKSNSNIYTLLYQQIGSIKTDQPLLFFNPSGSGKIAVLAGEGIWKWRMKEFSEHNNSNFTNDLVIKIVQYLSVREKKTPFRISYKNNFAENEPLIFDAELFNEAGEMVNTPDIKMTVIDAEKKSFPFTFTRTEKAYLLNAGNLPVGNYKFKAETKLGEKLYVESGEFSVSALQLESAETVANHQLLFAMSQKSGGKMLSEQEMDQLPKIISERGDVKPVIYSQKKLKDFINLKWFFFLLVAFLSAEWFLRKRSGAY